MTDQGDPPRSDVSARGEGEERAVAFSVDDEAEQHSLESDVAETLERITDAFYALDTEWRFTHLNERAEELIDFEGDGLVGEHVWETFEWAADSIFRDEYERAMATQEPTTFEVYYPDPLEAWFEVNAYPSETGLSVYFRDVTERKRRERELALFRDVLDYSTDSVYLIDPETGAILDVNETACRRTGYPRSELLARTVPDLETEIADRDEWCSVVAALKNDDLETFHGTRRCADGSTFPVEVNLSYVDLDREYVLAMARDITDRVEREAERARMVRELRESEERLRLALRAGEMGTWELDLRTEDSPVRSPTHDRIFGYEEPLEEWDFRTFLEHVHPDDRDEVERRFEEAFDSGKWEFECRITRADGERRVIAAQGEFYFDAAGEPVRAVGVVRDVTERYERERYLEDAKERLEAAAEAGAIGTWEWQIQENRMVVGASFARTFDVDPEAARDGLPLEEFVDSIHEDDRERVVAAVEAALESRSEYEEEYRVRNANDEIRWVLARGHVESDEDGAPETFPGALIDVTERKEAEVALRESEERYRTLFESIDEGFCIVEMLFDDDRSPVDYRIVEANPAFERYTGLEDAVGKTVNEMGANLEEYWYELYGRVALTGEPTQFEQHVEDWGLWFDGYAFRIGDPEERKVAILFDDVTERKGAEEALRESEAKFRAVAENLDEIVWIMESDASAYHYISPSFDDVWGVSRRTLYDDPDSYLQWVHPDDRDRVGENFAELPDAAFEDTFRIIRPDGELRWLRARGEQFEDDDGVCRIIGIGQDVTERVEYERALERRAREQAVIAQLGQRALETDDLDSFLHRACEMVADVLDVDYAEMLELDEESNELLVSHAVGFEESVVGSATVSAEQDSQAGYTLIREEPILAEELEAETRFSGHELLRTHGVVSGITVVVGSVSDPWGILGVHDAEKRAFNGADANFVQSVANVLATVIDRKRREAELRALNRLNHAIRDISLTATEAASREEIERGLCEQLAQTEPYAFAWVGTVERGRRTITPSASAGAGDGSLDGIEIATEGPETERGPIVRAIETGEPQFAQDLSTDPDSEAWYGRVETREFASSAALPIEHEGVTYGVLAVYADEPHSFDGPEAAMLAQLCELVGHAISAAERRKALVSDTATELEIRITDPDHPLLEATAGCSASVTYDRRIQTGEGRYVQFVTVRDMSRETFESAAETRPTVANVECIEERDDELVFEITMDSTPFADALAARGGRLREVSIANGAFQVLAELPSGADVREVLTAVSEIQPGTELLAQRTTERSDTTRRDLHGAITDRLTDKQHAALEAAYFAGYFEWPRVTTGEEVAELLDISPATLAQHIRTAERKLFETVFDEGSVTG